MRPSLGQMLSRLLSGTSLAGNDLPGRLRSTTLGLLGLVAAAGLGLVALIFQQSWPGVFSGPLPESPPSFERNDPIALIQPEAPLGRARPARQPQSRSVPTQARTRSPDVESQLAASRQVEVSAPAPAPAPNPPAPPPDPKSQSSPPPGPSTTTAPVAPSSADDSDSVPIAAGAEDDDDPPGRSGKSHRHSSHDSGRPSWAGHDGNDHGRDDDDDDDFDYDDRDYDYDDYGDYDDDDDDRGKRDWDDD